MHFQRARACGTATSTDDSHSQQLLTIRLLTGDRQNACHVIVFVIETQKKEIDDLSTAVADCVNGGGSILIALTSTLKA
jgi:hypothetical protein